MPDPLKAREGKCLRCAGSRVTYEPVPGTHTPKYVPCPDCAKPNEPSKCPKCGTELTGKCVTTPEGTFHWKCFGHYCQEIKSNWKWVEIAPTPSLPSPKGEPKIVCCGHGYSDHLFDLPGHPCNVVKCKCDGFKTSPVTAEGPTDEIYKAQRDEIEHERLKVKELCGLLYRAYLFVDRITGKTPFESELPAQLKEVFRNALRRYEFTAGQEAGRKGMK